MDALGWGQHFEDEWRMEMEGLEEDENDADEEFRQKYSHGDEDLGYFASPVTPRQTRDGGSDEEKGFKFESLDLEPVNTHLTPKQGEPSMTPIERRALRKSEKKAFNALILKAQALRSQPGRTLECLTLYQEASRIIEVSTSEKHQRVLHDVRTVIAALEAEVAPGPSPFKRKQEAPKSAYKMFSHVMKKRKPVGADDGKFRTAISRKWKSMDKSKRRKYEQMAHDEHVLRVKN